MERIVTNGIKFPSGVIDKFDFTEHWTLEQYESLFQAIVLHLNEEKPADIDQLISTITHALVLRLTLHNNIDTVTIIKCWLHHMRDSNVVDTTTMYDTLLSIGKQMNTLMTIEMNECNTMCAKYLVSTHKGCARSNTDHVHYFWIDLVVVFDEQNRDYNYNINYDKLSSLRVYSQHNHDHLQNMQLFYLYAVCFINAHSPLISLNNVQHTIVSFLKLFEMTNKLNFCGIDYTVEFYEYLVKCQTFIKQNRIYLLKDGNIEFLERWINVNLFDYGSLDNKNFEESDNIVSHFSNMRDLFVNNDSKEILMAMSDSQNKHVSDVFSRDCQKMICHHLTKHVESEYSVRNACHFKLQIYILMT